MISQIWSKKPRPRKRGHRRSVPVWFCQDDGLWRRMGHNSPPTARAPWIRDKDYDDKIKRGRQRKWLAFAEKCNTGL